MSGLLKPGQLLRNGEIEIIDQLGSGGVGEVYRVALVRRGQRQVMALKCFDSKLLEQSGLEAIEMVHRESLAVSKIKHPGIIAIDLVELERSMPYIVEEYFSGGDLSQLISERRRKVGPDKQIFSAEEIAHLAYQISSALVILHQNNLYHGDLKPQNLCFRDKDSLEIVIVDFGHAGFLEGNLLERNGNLATLAYVPPERTGFVKLAGNASSDLYSLGATLYECVVGTLPFAGQEGRDLINRLLYEVPKALHEMFPGFPVALSDIISKLLRKDPADRYHSAFGLSIDLERCLKALRSNQELLPFALGTKDKLRELNYRIPMVGRQDEMAMLHSLFDRTHGGEQALVLIGAPSGTGKSRLAFEILHRAKQQDALIHYVKFSEYERNLPLSAITLLLVEHCHYLRELSKESLASWQRLMVDKLGARLNLIVERYSFYAPFIPATDLVRSADRDNGFEVFNQTLGEFLSLLAAMGETQLLLIDDLQWADWQSLQVLSALGHKIIRGETPCTMLMGTYRSNEIDDAHMLNPTFLEMQQHYTLIELGPLAKGDADILVEHLLDEKGPEITKLQDVCYRFTSGNPFFIYEYLKSAINTGIFALNEDTQEWKFHEERIHEADLSSGVAGLVADRIRALNAVQQALISITSVAGHAMRRDALKRLLPLLTTHRLLKTEDLGSSDVDQTLELSYQELLQKNMLMPDLERFAFFHDKIQEASYSLLTEDEQKILHFEFGMICMDKIIKAYFKVNDGALFEAAYHIKRGQRKDLNADVRAFLILAARAAKRVFAYDKAKEYLQTLIEAIDAQPDIDADEKFVALEMLADILSISDQIVAAMDLYDQLLTFDCEPIKRAHIYAKKVEFCLNLFDYKKAKEASEAGLKVMGNRLFTTEFWSFAYIFATLPFLIVYCIYFKYFGKQTKEIKSEEEDIRFLLLIKSEISQYFTAPIVAIANVITLTFKLLRYKDNSYRATVMCYWGIALSAFGITRIADACFRHAYEYFDKTSNPVDKGFVLFTWGFSLDFPRGNLDEAQKKLEEAVFTLAPVGESFWRSTAIMGLILLDYNGAESGQAGIRSHEIVELWKKVRYAPTILGVAIRNHLEDGNDEQLNFLLQKVHEADLIIQNQGYDSIDSVLACIGIGEYHDYVGQYEEAERFAQRSFRLSLMRSHRVGYNLYTPILYARTLINRKKLGKAAAVLALAWVNQLMQVHIYHPQTCFETGRWLFAMNWPGLGRRMIEKGIRYASHRNWTTPAADGRLLLGQLLETCDSDLARAFLHSAKEHYHEKHWKFSESQCDREMNRIKMVRTEKNSRNSTRFSRRYEETRMGTGLRQQVEVQALMDVLLKLSAIHEADSLFRALMESLCQATGSELAVLYFEEDSRWVALTAHNIRIEQSDNFKNKVDQPFIQKVLNTRPTIPVVRRAQDKLYGHATTSGSALLLPLMAEGKVAGYCYLANSQLYDLFDKRSVEFAQPIASQGAIALRNIRLNKQLAIEKDEISKLHQTLELRVIEQTRDIKSIMKHIQMGICTVSGDEIVINKDYSTFLERVLGKAALHNKQLLPLLFDRSSFTEDEIDQAKQALSASLGGVEFMFDVNAHLLPRQITYQSNNKESVLELDWIPISDDNEKVERVLITVNDVTELRGLQAAAARKDEELHIISEILGPSERDWAQFSTNGQALLTRNHEQLLLLRAGGDSMDVLKKIFIHTHTLKGNARALGLRRMNQVIHENEQYFADCIRKGAMTMDADSLEKKLDDIELAFYEYQKIAQQKLGRNVSKLDSVSIAREPVSQMYDYLKAQADQSVNHILREIRSSLFISVRELFLQLFKEMQPLAAELGKLPPEFQLDLPDLWVGRPTEELFRNCLVHLLSNSFDHGLQSARVREQKGLSAQGCISISAEMSGPNIQFIFEDDGHGLNLKKLSEMGLQRGLLTSREAHDSQTIANLIFNPDLSTAREVSDLSGRGIGMTAVKEALESVGGHIEVRLNGDRMVEDGFSAFSFVISLPLGLFQVDTGQSAA